MRPPRARSEGGGDGATEGRRQRGAHIEGTCAVTAFVSSGPADGGQSSNVRPSRSDWWTRQPRCVNIPWWLTPWLGKKPRRAQSNPIVVAHRVGTGGLSERASLLWASSRW